jgi:hypothetical protein
VDGLICEYSCHKFASNVIEKCIQKSDFYQIENILYEIINKNQMYNQPKSKNEYHIKSYYND